MNKILVVLAGGLLLAGCASTGVRVDEKNLQSFKKGETTYSEVVARLGQPTSSTVMADGQRMIMYTYAQAQARPETFIPIVGAFGGGADYKLFERHAYVRFWKGVLTQYSSTQSQFGTGTGLAAGATPADRVSHQPRTDGTAH